MTRILESLEDVEVGGRNVYRCVSCGHELGESTHHYRELAASFETPISSAEPAHFAPREEAGDFVLRHFCCPNCGRLFEVDMVRHGEPNLESISLKH